MKKQPEALRLADALMEPVVLDKHAMQAAAELRRLSAVEFEWARLSQDEGKAELEIENDRLKQHMNALNEWCLKDKELIGELLEALKNLEKEFRQVYPIYYYAEPWGHEVNVPLQAARAAIAKAGGEA